MEHLDILKLLNLKFEIFRLHINLWLYKKNLQINLQTKLFHLFFIIPKIRKNYYNLFHIV